MKKSILEAIRRFEAGERPKNFRMPDWWYVASSDGTLYPAKGIWALVVDKAPRSFNTKDAQVGLAEAGFSLVDIRDKDDHENFAKRVSKSSKGSDAARKKRLQDASKKPKKRLKVTYDFVRNPDVVAETLKRAQGICENCQSIAPFTRRSDKSPYLEVHHKTTLANGGDDTVENAEALCPNCHREKHFG